jgi:hypothetical protein
MMTRNGMLIERVTLAEGTIQETTIVAREIVGVDQGSVYELSIEGRVIGHLKLIEGAHAVKAYAQKTRDSGRIYLGKGLDFSDAVDWAIGVL